MTLLRQPRCRSTARFVHRIPVALSLLTWVSCSDSLSLEQSDEAQEGEDAAVVLQEVCDDGLDNDRDGEIDEECACEPGAVQPCYVGAARTRHHAPCADGEQTCVGVSADDAHWGPCEGSALPLGDDDCDDGIDQDCNGVVDDGPWCSAGQAGEGDEGLCRGEFAVLCEGNRGLDIDPIVDEGVNGGGNGGVVGGGGGNGGVVGGGGGGTVGGGGGTVGGGGGTVGGGGGTIGGEGIFCNSCLTGLSEQFRNIRLGPLPLDPISSDLHGCLGGKVAHVDLTQMKVNGTLHEVEARAGEPFIVVHARVSATLDGHLDAENVACSLGADCDVTITASDVPAEVRVVATQTDDRIAVRESQVLIYLTQNRLDLDLSECGALGTGAKHLWNVAAPIVLEKLRAKLQADLQDQVNALDFSLPSF
jgi:hypothetical protein